MGEVSQHTVTFLPAAPSAAQLDAGNRHEQKKRRAGHQAKTAEGSNAFLVCWLNMGIQQFVFKRNLF